LSLEKNKALGRVIWLLKPFRRAYWIRNFQERTRWGNVGHNPLGCRNIRVRRGGKTFRVPVAVVRPTGLWRWRWMAALTASAFPSRIDTTGAIRGALAVMRVFNRLALIKGSFPQRVKGADANKVQEK